ncbi:MAG: hypothetical protein AABW51_04620 [Nanoarchaeota archaeon]
MFNKEECKNCKNKYKGSYAFCPHCGHPTGKPPKEEDLGMLGKDDEMEDFSHPLFGGISGKMLNKMLGSAMKMLEKEIQKSMVQEAPSKTNFELYINGKKIDPRNIKVTKTPVYEKPVRTKNVQTYFDESSQQKFLKLPKKEPTTSIRRLANKVVYEIDIPGVESIKDISIVKLENSIEIKAIAKDKAYSKLIPIDLPIKNFKLDHNKLVLELSVKG